MYDTLIDAEQLSGKLEDPDWVVVDCRFDLMQPDAGRDAYLAGHIPGAQYAHLNDDLSAPVTVTRGRHPLPAVDDFVSRLRAWGVNARSQVVVYDDMGGAIAARLWWLLRWLGHRAVAVLDGGLSAWRGAKLPVAQACPPVGQGDISALPGCVALVATEVSAGVPVSTEGLLANLQTSHYRMVDARAQARFRGEQEPIDPVAGHIPGAMNHPHTQNLREGRFKSPQALRRQWLDLLGDRPVDDVVHQCGSGVTACHNILSMEVAGLSGSRLYAGSWSEWIRDPNRPVARG